METRLGRSRMVGFLLYRFFVSSWIRRRTRSQAAIGVVLPVLGVSIGVAAFTIVLSIMGGFVSNLRERLLGIEPHLEIVKSGEFGYLEPHGSTLKAIGEVTGVTAVSPFQNGDAILQSASRPATITLIGVDPRNAEVFARFEPFMGNGFKFRDLEKKSGPDGAGTDFPPVVLGSGVARALEVQVGDRVTFVSTIPESGAFGMAPKQLPARVVEILKTGSSRYDGKVVFSSLQFANRFFDVESGWAGVQVLTSNPENLDPLLAKLGPVISPLGARAKPWTESNEALLRALKLERWGMSFVLYMVILVGCFTISITLVLSVRRKAREMAILRAIGFERRELGRVYVFQGLVIGAVGVALGLGFGLLSLHILSTSQLPFLNQSYSGKPFPVLIDWMDCGRVVIGSLVLSMIASVWPAWEVMRINVVETLSDRA